MKTNLTKKDKPVIKMFKTGLKKMYNDYYSDYVCQAPQKYLSDMTKMPSFLMVFHRVLL